MKINIVVTLAAAAVLALCSCAPAEELPAAEATSVSPSVISMGEPIFPQDSELTLESVTFARAINDGNLVCRYDEEVKYIDIIWTVKNPGPEPIYLNELFSATLYTGNNTYSRFRYFVSETSLIAFDPVIEAGAEKTVHMFTSLPISEDTTGARLEMTAGSERYTISSGFADICDFQEKSRHSYAEMERIIKDLSERLENSWSFSYPYSPDEVRAEIAQALQGTGAKNALNELNSVASPPGYSAGYELLRLQEENFIEGCERIAANMTWSDFDCITALRNLINAYQSEDIMSDIHAFMPYLTDSYAPSI